MNQKTTTTSIIFGIIFLLLILLIISPLFNKIKEESDNLIAQKKTLIELSNKTENLNKFQTNYQAYQPNFKKIDQLFIDPEEPIDFIKFLEKEASDFQLSIEISPQPTKEVKGDLWPSMNFRLALLGSFPNFLRFLEKLESSSYLINISNLSLTLTKETTRDVSASFLIKIYTQGKKD